jgi:hypothetical protein
MVVIWNRPGIIGVLIALGPGGLVGATSDSFLEGLAIFGFAAGAYGSVTDRYPGGFSFKHVTASWAPYVTPTARMAVFQLPLFTYPILLLPFILLFWAARGLADPGHVLAIYGGVFVGSGALWSLTEDRRYVPVDPPDESWSERRPQDPKEGGW